MNFVYIIVEYFDALYAYFEVERTFIYYLNKAYIPTMLLVCFNLGSYWIPDRAVPARVSLIITTFLSSMFILMSVTDETVKVSYISAMLVFMLVNIAFLVTASLDHQQRMHAAFGQGSPFTYASVSKVRLSRSRGVIPTWARVQRKRCMKCSSRWLGTQHCTKVASS